MKKFFKKFRFCMEDDINLLHRAKPAVFAIDASSANKQHRTGVEQYAYHLIEAMKREPLRQGERVFLYAPSALEGALADVPSGWESRVLPWRLGRGWMQGRVSWELLRRRPDVLFVPSQGLPRFFFGTPVVTTVHDVAFRRIGGLYDPSVRRRLARTTRRAVNTAAHLFAVSETTKRDLQEFYHLADHQITVTPLAADTTLYRRLDTAAVATILRKLRIGRSFFLSVGRLEKKKNIATLIRAFELFKQDRGVGDPFELVLAGPAGYGYGEIKAMADRSSARELIREVGYLPDEEIAALMNSATACCLPSAYEGFGLPIVEAMSCGAPLILSDIPVHHEVAGDAARYAPVDAPEVWARQMETLVSDTDTRDLQVEKGTVRASGFSWGHTARATWSVMRSLV
ncbi:glycosyltransferase family 4 protein [Candidatus Parcubacteria bacterium]|nr:glycosyltransferase family 4 protein [Candidatus Parcubacteria bacterium]